MIGDKIMTDQELKEIFPTERVHTIYQLANKNSGFDEVWKISTAGSREKLIKKLVEKINDEP